MKSSSTCWFGVFVMCGAGTCLIIQQTHTAQNHYDVAQQTVAVQEVPVQGIEKSVIYEHREPTTYKKLYRSRTDRVIAGVCGGLGHYFNVDPTLMRLIMVTAGFAGVGVVGYLVGWLIIPLEPERM